MPHIFANLGSTSLVKALNVLGFTCVAPVFRPLVLCSLFVPFQRKARLCQPSLTSGSGSRWPLNPQRPAKILPYFSFKSLNSLLFLGWLIVMWSLIVVVTRSCLLLNSARLSSDQSEINEVDYLSHEQRAIISVGSLFFVIAQFVVMKGEVEMTGRGRRSFERVGLRKLLA